MLIISFIPWIFYTLLLIKYNKKQYHIINIKLIIAILLYLYFIKVRNSEVLGVMFFVLGLFLFIDTYYAIPKSKEKQKNTYAKYMYIIPFIPLIGYLCFHHYKVIVLGTIITSYVIELFLYFYHKKH